MAKQMTLKAAFTLEGKGLHTGLNVVLTAKPAAENTGIIVRRVDLEADNEIPALAENVAATERGTVLVKGEAKVSTIEHCMAALYAAGVDNCELEVNAPEFPILDGSAKPFVDAINSVGVEEQSADDGKVNLNLASKEELMTLPGIGESKANNIIKYRISPINISVHTTNPELRKTMIKNKFAGNLYSIMQRLAKAQIQMNCQIVLCPGYNDKEELERTVSDLANLYPYVNSVAAVPVGITKHRDHLPNLEIFNEKT